ncbi:SGNH/GDSL hydrolase family protein [Sphaerotilus sp.]|jgi:outer membrane lipase/esterase|uniref:SGNH/GDSL hydrolase family protein n=1 Tax=Sphaerotilus sp. TaxID=2093942 RepID=UPI0025FDAC02|nr:SGNH/GDSL hydrolase family protein [Sphaerotilus sp.]
MNVLKFLLAPALCAALLGGCGGSSSRVEDYVPTRLVAFGDELSLINADGSKYSVNAFKPNTAVLDCVNYPVWPQVVASGFGMVFAECNQAAVATTAAVMKAAAGAKVADVAAAVAAYQATTVFTPQTLVTVMAGQNDILAAYAAYDAGTLTRAAAKTQAAAVGKTLGALVNRVANLGSGARVLYATPPNLGYSPYAATEVARTGDADRAALLRELTLVFVEGLRTEVLNDGRYAALITGDELTISLSDLTRMTANLLTNITDAACTTALPACTTATLVSGAAGSGTTYLWADAQHPSALFQSRVGAAAFNRARNNPF